MKMITAFAVLLLSVTASARSPIYSQSKYLGTVIINNEETDLVAQLKLDYIQDVIQVRIYNDICNSMDLSDMGPKCKAMPMLVETLAVPTAGVSNDCGTDIYTGKTLMNDEESLQIQVLDHTKRSCENVIIAILEVQAVKVDAKTGKTTTYHMH